MRRLTQEDFLLRAREVHGRRYGYSESVFVTTSHTITIACPVHGKFTQKAASHLSGSGCRRCGFEHKQNLGVKYTTKSFIKRAREVHGSRYSYKRAAYVSAGKHVEIECPVHGVFKQRPRNHLSGQGCPKCTDISSLCTASDFVERSHEVHGGVYDYSEYVFKNVTTKGKIVCPEHGAFYRSMDKHLRHRSGCPKCCKVYSRMAIAWIEQEAKHRRLRNVQHAENGGEVYIKEAKAYADGYHARSRTIFEFYGDRFHGNPALFKPLSKPHPFNKSVTAGQLYRKTLARQALLESLGYTVVCMWEHDVKSQVNRKCYTSKT